MYRVIVDDNYHYRDESERYDAGTYPSFEEAVAACEAIVDAYLADVYVEGMSAGELRRSYLSFGEDPFVIPVPEDQTMFSAWDYAEKRCAQLCGGSA